MKFSYPDGATPLDADAAAELRQAGITTQAQLNALEQENIVQALRWTFRMKPERLIKIALSQTGLCELHRQMFGNVWKWAGTLRKRELNIGCRWYDVEPRLQELCEDVLMQLEQASMALDEIGIRYHHRLVSIHPFVNGNGRHARMGADLLMRAYGQSVFTWGSGGDLIGTSQTRSRYISALKLADGHDLSALLDFARS